MLTDKTKIHSVKNILKGILFSASSVILVRVCLNHNWNPHLGVARSERCGLSHQMDGKPLDNFLVLVIHDVHHLSVQTHEHLKRG